MGDSASTIGPGQIVRGEIHGRGSLDVHGRVEGRIRLVGPLRIHAGGVVAAEVHAHTLTVSGTLAGSAEVTTVTRLDASARVVADIRTGAVAIADGAAIAGVVEVLAEDAPSSGAPSRGASDAPPSRPRENDRHVAEPTKEAPSPVRPVQEAPVDAVAASGSEPESGSGSGSELAQGASLGAKKGDDDAMADESLDEEAGADAGADDRAGDEGQENLSLASPPSEPRSRRGGRKGRA